MYISQNEDKDQYLVKVAKTLVDNVLNSAVFIHVSNINIDKNRTQGSDLILKDEESEVTTEELSHLYGPTEKEAFLMIDRAINSAVIRLQNEMKDNVKTTESKVSDEIIKFKMQKPFLAEHTTVVANIEWPSIMKFDNSLGKSKIHEFILTWKIGDDWLYCIDYLGLLETRFDKRHRYRVRFSIPTPGKPIPQASVSVYFTIIVSKIKPPHYIVEVFYVLESNHLVHKPGQYLFCELWLRRIVDYKSSLIKSIGF